MTINCRSRVLKSLFVGGGRFRCDAKFLVVEASSERFVRPDNLDTASGVDGGFHSHAPIDGVDHHPTPADVFEIGAAAQGGVKHSGSLTHCWSASS